ncbi:hypothetical protein BDV95DRAFT_556821 [Massariosphaeria phaeospora]|uniref:WW domain-containing protein n=1 Tax=Massariosphaeria phaeospora TaxID=100035 RepID=A0A7C8MH41_9PLEO|nr:hypothetical protein BDV95DRAFT_556821 [Massariosphaeria phaeospora]
MSMLHPDDAPPSYEAATSSTAAQGRVSTDGPAARTSRSGIPPEHRRSMEDETRPLPPGWIRQFDADEQHQFFVDTNANPPRSIWTHPYDDPDFLATLSPEERKKHSRLHRTMTLEDLAAESSDDEDRLPPRPKPAASGAGRGSRSSSPQPQGLHKFGRKMKDKITQTTHEQREADRRRREEQERRAYQTHLQARQAMIRALQTGEPQLLGKDRQGRDLYVMPPGGGSGVPRGAFGYNPYAQGPYALQNARYRRPIGPYGRPYGYGYGGGLGAPVAAGLLGGTLLGGLMF